jgi:hypothetical protein
LSNFSSSQIERVGEVWWRALYSDFKVMPMLIPHYAIAPEEGATEQDYDLLFKTHNLHAEDYSSTTYDLCHSGNLFLQQSVSLGRDHSM